jgi:hypothetical protein
VDQFKVKDQLEGKTLRVYTSENIYSSWLNFVGKSHKCISLQSQISAMKERLLDWTLMRKSPPLDSTLKQLPQNGSLQCQISALKERRLDTPENISSSWLNFEGKNHKVDQFIVKDQLLRKDSNTLHYEGKTLRLYTSDHISSSWLNFEGKNHKSGSLQSQRLALKERF